MRAAFATSLLAPLLATVVATLVTASPARADDGPAPLPKRCAADSPTDAPCTKLAGRYRITLAPRGQACVVTKPATGILTVRGEGKTPAFDAKPLVRALGLTPGKDDAPSLSAARRDGVCCIDLRLYGHAGDRGQRITVSLAAGATTVNAKARDRWTQDDPGRDECGDADLAVTVERVR
ncbi:MAG: hypothetical protein JNK64_33280 [Myxococcales bacterium]|nr:hypothetical protein [Myxococcales bacterium]